MTIGAFVLNCCALSLAMGQVMSPLRFDVASVKLSSLPTTLPAGAVPAPSKDGGPGSGRISYRYYSLNTLIQSAFGVRSMQVVAPSWAARELYDIVASLPSDATNEQIQVMLQNLLIDRFGLLYHREDRELPVYALTVGKQGSKLKNSSTDVGLKDSRSAAEASDGFPTPNPDYAGTLSRPSTGVLRITGQKASISQLIASVTGPILEYPIVDQTGLTGQYDFKIEMEWMRRPGTTTPDGMDAPPSVFQALDKLGLRLEKKQVMFETIVVDQVNRIPTEN